MTTIRRSSVLTVFVVAVAIGLAGCGGPGSPSVANVSTNSGASASSTATTLAKNNAAQSLVEWANCMHSHGDPNQADPTIDAHEGINIHIPTGAESLSNAVHNGTAPCNEYLSAASAALRAGMPNMQPPDQAALVKYSQCMRTNGVPNYPDPGTGGETNFNGTGVDPNSPFVQRANNVCGKKIDAPSWWISGAGPPGDISVQSGPAGISGAVPHRGAVVNGPAASGAVPVTGG